MDGLIANYKRLLRLTDTSFHRYMYDKVNWNGRLVGIVGARGVGKTTMILQYIKEQLDVDSTLYVNAEDFFFINQLRVIGGPIASPASDFLVGERTFEVAGRNKKQRQIRGVRNAFVVKDDIEYGGLNVVPLWQFGMLYRQVSDRFS